MNEEKKWWYEHDGVQKGAIAENEIIDLIKYGVLKPDNLVWQQGFETWIMLKNSTLSKYLENNDLLAFKETNTIESLDKWYNDKIKLGLSFFFFPVFLYGVYKTKLLNDWVKYIIYGGFVLIVVFGKSENPGYNYDTSIGPRQSGWDHSVSCVESYLKKGYLRDPDSYESVNWGRVEKNNDGTYEVTHTFRARNGFGGMDEETKTFIIGSDGSNEWKVINVY